MSGVKPRDVLVAVPTRGQVAWGTATRLQEIRDARPGLPPILYEPGNLSVALTRNQIVGKFLDGPWRVLAMVDDDVMPPPRFLDMADKLDGYAMLGVPYPLVLNAQLGLAVFTEDSNGRLRYGRIQTGVHECEAIGTGCVMIPRETFDIVGEAPFRMQHDPKADEVSDDFLFCRALRAAGLKVGYWLASDGYANHHRVVGLGEMYEIQSAMLSGGRVAV